MNEQIIELAHIQNILRGNRLSERYIYEKYRTIIRDYIRSKYPNNLDIDDDVSEVLIKMFKYLESYDNSKSKFKSWVFNIAKNHMIDKWRGINIDCLSVSSFTNPDALDHVLYKTNNITENSFNFESDNTLNYFKAQLSENENTMLDMKYNQGYSYNEIGKMFNISSSTVSNQVNYVKTKLKKINKTFAV